MNDRVMNPARDTPKSDTTTHQQLESSDTPDMVQSSPRAASETLKKFRFSLIIIIFCALVIGGFGVWYVKYRSITPDLDAKLQRNRQYTGKKILIIDSYNVDVDAFKLKMTGIEKVLNATDVEVKTVHMDEKKNPEKEFQLKTALQVKSVVEDFKPDVILSLDDPAFEYVIMPYYRDSNIPIVFSGVNWDVSPYGAPYKNTAGMEEVALIDQLIDYLATYSKGDRIGLLAGNTATDNKNADYYRKLFNISFAKQYHVDTFEEWKQSFLNLQTETDYILIENNAGIKNWDDTKAETFVLENTKIPAGAVLEYIVPYSLLGLTKVTEELGEFAATSALRILDGENPSEIGVVQNKKGDLILNMKIAKKLNISFTPNMIRAAKNILKEE